MRKATHSVRYIEYHLKHIEQTSTSRQAARMEKKDQIDKNAVSLTTKPAELEDFEQEISDRMSRGEVKTFELGDDGEMHEIEFK